MFLAVYSLGDHIHFNLTELVQTLVAVVGKNCRERNFSRSTDSLFKLLFEKVIRCSEFLNRSKVDELLISND